MKNFDPSFCAIFFYFSLLAFLFYLATHILQQKMYEKLATV